MLFRSVDGLQNSEVDVNGAFGISLRASNGFIGDSGYLEIVSGTNSPVFAQAKGVVALSTTVGDLRIDSITSQTAGVNLISAGSIIDHNNSAAADIVTATGVWLTATNGGSIGDIDNLEIETSDGAPVNATAPGNVRLRELTNDMAVQWVQSSQGMVYLQSARSIVDALNTDAVDVFAGGSVELAAGTGSIGDIGAIEVDTGATGLLKIGRAHV